jgi:hypothetical protein
VVKLIGIVDRAGRNRPRATLASEQFASEDEGFMNPLNESAQSMIAKSGRRLRKRPVPATARDGGDMLHE